MHDAPGAVREQTGLGAGTLGAAVTGLELDPKVLKDLGTKFCEAAGKDLAALLEREVVLSDVKAKSVKADALFEEDDPVLHLCCGTGEKGGLVVHVLLSMPDALALGALRAGEEASAAREQTLEGSLAEGFDEVAKLSVAVLSRLLEEAHGSAPFAVESALPVEKPASEAGWLPSGSYWLLQMGLEVEDLLEGTLSILIPEELSGTDATQESQAEDDGLALLVVDPCEEHRELLEEMSEPLAREITVLAPGELNLKELEEVQEAYAVVVSWELSGRSGLELVEYLARDERTARVPLLVAAENPTPEMVRAAFRAGACSFVCKPYEVEELRTRVLAARKAAHEAEMAAETA